MYSSGTVVVHAYSVEVLSTSYYNGDDVEMAILFRVVCAEVTYFTPMKIGRDNRQCGDTIEISAAILGTDLHLPTWHLAHAPF